MAEDGLILAGDIGGTKTYLGLFESSGGGAELRLVKEAKFSNASYPGPDRIISEFLGPEAEGVSKACLGIACPVRQNRCELTNLKWTVDGGEIADKFGFAGLGLINDLEAVGWSVDVLTGPDLYTLEPGIDARGNKALIAPGTGLGEAILFWDGATHVPSASEGGHTDFAPRNDLEAGLWRHVSEKYGHVSYERVVSGMGLKDLYEYMLGTVGGETPVELAERFKTEGHGPVVTEQALTGSDDACVKTMHLFVSLLGAEAGNLALKAMATGGVYIGGGIAPRILELLKKGPFRESFLDKGRFGELLSGMPVHVILNDRAALFGAACYAAAGRTPEGRVEKVVRKIEASGETEVAK